MIIPAAMFIETAADALSTIDQWQRRDQQDELSTFGYIRAQKIGATGCDGMLSDDFRTGYELGLQTMRVLLAGNLAAVQAKIDL